MEIQTIIFNLLYSMFGAGVVTFITIMFIENIITPFRRSKALREARDAGHEVVAKQVRYKNEYTYGGSETWGYFEYEYDNRTYVYKRRFNSLPPKEITLYFKTKP